MLLRRNGWGGWLALAAAWLIAAQAIFATAALTSPASALAGAPICAAHALDPARANFPDHSHLRHACCLSGCAMCAPAAAPPLTLALDARRPIRIAASALRFEERRILFRERNQRQPRAPPQTA